MEAAHTPRPSLGELFVERGLISEEDLQRALAEQAATKSRLADVLVRRGLVSGHDITKALMEQLDPTMRARVAAASAPEAPAPAPDTADVVTLPAPTLVPPAAETVEEAPEQREPAPRPSTLTPSISAQTLIAEAESRRRDAQDELDAAREADAPVLQSIEQVRVELEARDLFTDGLARELTETQARLRNREDDLARAVAIWEEAKREAERWGGELAELQDRLEEKQQELSEARASAATWAARAAELETESDALTERVGTAVAALEDLAAERFAANGDNSAPAPGDGQDSESGEAQTAVLYFLPKAEGYDLVEREGEVPAVGERLEFGEQQYVVEKLGRSPLPFDGRDCVYLSAV